MLSKELKFCRKTCKNMHALNSHLNFTTVTVTPANYTAPLDLLVQHSEEFYIMATEH